MNKKYLGLATALLLLAGGATAQQKLSDGTEGGGISANPNAILELSSTNKGLLHTRIALTRTTEASPLTAHVAGMMVYNTATANDVVPGIYYNDGAKWIVVAPGISSNISYNPSTYVINYVDAEGNPQTINLVPAIKDNETKTLLVNNGGGKYTYYNEESINEDGTPDLTKGVVIDVAQDVIENFETIVNESNTEVIEQLITVLGDTYVGGNVYYDGDTFTYVDEAGDSHVINFEEIVQANETVTTLDKLGEGQYLYTSEDGTETTINVAQDVIENFETIVNESNTEVIEQLITVLGDTYVGGNVYYDGDTFTYVDEAGDSHVINFEEIVQANETRTFITDEDGVYTYTNEKNETFVIDVPASVVEQFENIYNQIVNEEITVNGDLYETFEEYLTTIVNANTNFEDNEFITVTGTGTDTDPFKIEIKEGDANSMLITNEDGDLEWATIEEIVQANETRTFITEEDGVYTYTNEKNETFVIDVPASVVEQFENIYNQIVNEEITVNGDLYETFEEYLTTIVNANTNFEDNDFITVTGTGTDTDPFKIEIKEGDANSMLITNEDGDLEWATIEEIVQANETRTFITDEDGVYTYTNEKNETFVIDVPASVVENFETIVNSGPVIINGDEFTTIEEYIENIANSSVSIGGSDFISVTGTGTATDPYKVEIKEGDANSMLITNEDGDLEWATIESIVQANETITKVVDNTDGTYTYINEDEDEFVISIPASIVESFETIVNSGPVIVEGEEYTTIEEYIEYIANASVTVEGSDFITVTGDGTSGNPYHVEIKEGDANSMLITNSDGDLEWATIESIVQANETVTTLDKLGEGQYLYTSEDGTETTINVAQDVIENFETIVNESNTEVIEQLITVLGDTYVGGNVYYDGDTFTYVDESGDSHVINFEEIVQANETRTYIEGEDGVYTYYNEKAEPFIIDIPASVVENIQNEGDVYTEIINLIDANDTNTTNERFEIIGANLVITDSDDNTVEVLLEDLAAAIDTNTEISNFAIVGTNIVLTDDNGGSWSIPLADLADAIDTDTKIYSFGIDNGSIVLKDDNEGSWSISLDELQSYIDTDTDVRNLEFTIDGDDLVLTDTEGGTVKIALSAINSKSVVTPVVTTGNTIATHNDGDGTTVNIQETITKLEQNLTTSEITYTNEANAEQKAMVVSKNDGNQITVGTDGGAYYNKGNSIVSVAGNYDVEDKDETVLINADGGATINIPAAADADGRILTIRKTDHTYGVLTFSQTINHSSGVTFATTNVNGTIKIQSDGTNWYMIN